MIWFFVVTQLFVVLVLRALFQLLVFMVWILASTTRALAGSTQRAWRRRRQRPSEVTW